MQGDKAEVAEHLGVLARGMANHAREAGLVEVARHLERAAVAADKLKGDLTAGDHRVGEGLE